VGHDAAEALRVEVARALIERTGWTEANPSDVAKHVSVESGGELAYVEFRWSGGGVVAGVVSDECVDADEYAEAVAAELKHRIGRFGTQLPWR
jgi:hypothetical protein